MFITGKIFKDWNGTHEKSLWNKYLSSYSWEFLLGHFYCWMRNVSSTYMNSTIMKIPFFKSCFYFSNKPKSCLFCLRFVMINYFHERLHIVKSDQPYPTAYSTYTVDTTLVTQFWHSRIDTLFTAKNCFTKGKFAESRILIWVFTYWSSLFSVRMKARCKFVSLRDRHKICLTLL